MRRAARAAGLAIAACLSCACSAQAERLCPPPLELTRGLQQPLAAVRYLADDALEGRLAGSRGERCAVDYIAAEFARIGLEPGAPDGGYLQAFELQSALPRAPSGTGYNVVGVLEGSDPQRRNEVVVIGAHHDHLGRGELRSLAGDDFPAGSVHNGADDNASGVGALLAVAETLARSPPPRSVVFVTFSGEEFGLLGSAHYVTNPIVPLDDKLAMINLDMVGRLEDDPLIVYGTGTAEEWDAILDELEDMHALSIERQPEGYGPSDHTSFYARDIPVLHFFTNVHAQYHRPSDEWEHIDREGLARVADVAADAVRAVASRETRLTHLAGAGTPRSPGEDVGWESYLGTVPDFAPVDIGVRLSGVAAGSPAERAGLRAGDVLIRLGDVEAVNLNAFADALRAFAPGERVEVTVLRDGAEHRVEVVLGRR